MEKTGNIKQQKHWARTLLSFFMVLFTMPLGHAIMILMDNTMTAGAVHVAAFLMGLAGLMIVIMGVFVKGDTRQTLFGFFGGLLFWTGWVEFLFQPQIRNPTKVSERCGPNRQECDFSSLD